MNRTASALQITAHEARNVVRRLAEGEVPDPGARLIAVGRKAEIETLLRDLDDAEQGGGSMRVVTGGFGAGKTFLLALAKFNALDRGFVVGRADLSPHVHFAGECALDLYRQVMKSMSTRAKMGGGAVPSIVQRFITAAEERALGGREPGDTPLNEEERQALVDAEIRRTMQGIGEGVANSYDFGRIIAAYARGYRAGQRPLFLSRATGAWELVGGRHGTPRGRERLMSGDEVCDASIRWLRGEYGRLADAKQDLGVGAIPTAATWYEMLKSFCGVVRAAGYRGVVVDIDEIHHVLTHNATVRQRNWDMLLTLYNNAARGEANGLVVLLGATRESYLDPRMGMCSYPALRSRLQSSSFARGEYGTNHTPVIALEPLSLEDQVAALQRIDACHKVATGRTSEVATSDIAAFLDRLNRRVGARIGQRDSLVSPRDQMRAWVDALNAWYQHPDVPLVQILGEVQLFSSTQYGTRALTGVAENGALFAGVGDAQTPGEYAAVRQTEMVVDELADDFGAVAR